jgi:GntR family transcriptional regulator of vanillate catabolism
MSRQAPQRSDPTPHGERTDNTYVRLREAIVRGHLPAGARITEAALALRLGVSRTPVRTALDRLAQERFLVPSTIGLRIELAVAPLTQSDVRELWTLMGALEGAAAAGMHDLGRNALHDLAANMSATNDALALLVRKRVRDTDRIGELMARFHVQFVERCGGPRILALHQSVLPHVQRYEWAFDSVHDYAPSTQEHRAICNAIHSIDVDRVRRLVEQHWQRGMHRRLEQLPPEQR